MVVQVNYPAKRLSEKSKYSKCLVKRYVFSDRLKMSSYSAIWTSRPSSFHMGALWSCVACLSCISSDAGSSHVELMVRAECEEGCLQVGIRCGYL